MSTLAPKLSLAMKTLAFILGLSLTLWVRSALTVRATPPPIPANPQRVISLAPSVTETLYALNLGDRVVGRTRYCQYPPEVQDLPIVASFQELNYEAIIRLKPDLVVLPVDRLSSIERLTRLGLPVLTLDTRSLDGFREAVFKLGEALNRRAEAKTILNNLNQSEDYARKASIGQARPKVLFSVMHNYEGLGYINEINAVGEDGFFSQIIKIAGADNAYAGPLAFPRLSRESIIFLNPDVIVDILLETDDLTAVRADWRSLSAVKAIENERLYFLTNQSDTVPGPRSYLTIQRLADFFHPAKESVNDAHPGS